MNTPDDFGSSDPLRELLGLLRNIMHPATPPPPREECLSWSAQRAEQMRAECDDGSYPLRARLVGHFQMARKGWRDRVTAAGGPVPWMNAAMAEARAEGLLAPYDFGEITATWATLTAWSEREYAKQIAAQAKRAQAKAAAQEAQA